MSFPLHILWYSGSEMLQGLDMPSQKWKQGHFSYGPGFPGEVTEARQLVLSTSALFRSTFDVLVDCTLHLEAAEEVLNLLDSVWPESGGGVEVSFDNGVTWQLLTSAPLPVRVVVPGTTKTTQDLSPFDSIWILVRVKVPIDYTVYGPLDFAIGLDCDVQ